MSQSETSTEYDHVLDEIESFVEKDKKNRKYIYNWLAYWDQRQHHFSRAWKQAGAPLKNLLKSFNSRYMQLIDAAKSDTAYALSLDRYLTKYTEGGEKNQGTENVCSAKDFPEQRKRATTDTTDDEGRAKRRQGWRKQGSDRSKG